MDLVVTTPGVSTATVRTALDSESESRDRLLVIDRATRCGSTTVDPTDSRLRDPRRLGTTRSTGSSSVSEAGRRRRGGSNRGSTVPSRLFRSAMGSGAVVIASDNSERRLKRSRTNPSVMSRRLSMGIDVLDRQLDGGIPTGSIVLFSADPASQSELLLYEVTAVRTALYLTTIRSDQAVQDALDRTSRYTRVGEPTIRDIGVEAPLDQGNKLLGTLPTESTLIVDTLDPLER